MKTKYTQFKHEGKVTTMPIKVFKSQDEADKHAKRTKHKALHAKVRGDTSVNYETRRKAKFGKSTSDVGKILDRKMGKGE